MKHVKLPNHQRIQAIGNDGNNYIVGCQSFKKGEICLYRIGYGNKEFAIENQYNDNPYACFVYFAAFHRANVYEFNENYFVWINAGEKLTFSNYVKLLVSDDYGERIEKMKYGEIVVMNRRTNSMKIFSLPWSKAIHFDCVAKIALDNLTFAVAKGDEMFIMDVDI
jgi:hypothetical protein